MLIQQGCFDLRKPASLFISTILMIATLGIATVAKADTVNARCDVYPKGVDRAISSGACTFSQRQGAVGIQLQNGKRYDLQPVGNTPGNYRDQSGRAAYRQSGLDDRGLIFQTASERIFVYWDTAGISNGSSSRPVANRPSGNGGFVTLKANEPNARINLRSRATIDSSVEGYGIAGDRVQLLECVQDYDRSGSDLNWCQVRFPRSQAVGWVRSDFLIFQDAGE